MRKLAVLSMFALLFVATFANAQCGPNCLFYGGDFDPNNPNANGLANENDAIVGGDPYGAATYQNVIVDATWHVTTMFTNNLSTLDPTAGYWEVRSGISEGNGGTLVASGTGAMTQTPTGRSGFGLTEYRDAVNLDLLVNPGTYWHVVVPICIQCNGRSFNSNTFGLNKVGNYTDNDQFFNSAFFGANFTNANNEGVFQAFSTGANGTVVPEPSSILMVGSGLIGVAGVIRRRLSR